MPVDVAVSIPQLVGDGRFDGDALRAYLNRTEELGFTGVWATEQVVGSAPNLDPTALLGFAAACTQRVRLGCAVYVSTLHSPLHLAKAVATLDQMTGGRLDVGLGTGGGFRPFAAFGIERDGYLSRFTEGLALMKAAWTQDRVNVDGRFFQGSGLAAEPKPFQKPYPPIWFGGGHPNSLRRAVRLADGFMGAGSTATETFLGQARILHEELDRAERARSDFRIGKRVYLAVDDGEPARAGERLSQALHGLYDYYGIPNVERVGVAGTAAQVTEVLRSIVAADVDLLLLHPLFDEREQMERLAADVVPALV